MYQRRPKRFRRHSNGRNHQTRGNGEMQRLRTDLYSNDQTRNRFRPTQSAERLFEKYNTLAKEALSSGDKTLSENYFQHADHFMRVIEDKNRNQNRVQVLDKTASDDKHSAGNTVNNKDTTNEEKKK